MYGSPMTTTAHPELDRVPVHSPRCEADQGDPHCEACAVLAAYADWRNDDDAHDVHPFNLLCTCPHCEATWVKE